MSINLEKEEERVKALQKQLREKHRKIAKAKKDEELKEIKVKYGSVENALLTLKKYTAVIDITDDDQFVRLNKILSMNIAEQGQPTRTAKSLIIEQVK